MHFDEPHVDESRAVPLLRVDAVALIGVLARLEGESLARHLDPDLEAALAARLWREGRALTADAQGLQTALHALGERLRRALGE